MLHSKSLCVQERRAWEAGGQKTRIGGVKTEIPPVGHWFGRLDRKIQELHLFHSRRTRHPHQQRCHRLQNGLNCSVYRASYKHSSCQFHRDSKHDSCSSSSYPPRGTDRKRLFHGVQTQSSELWVTEEVLGSSVDRGGGGGVDETVCRWCVCRGSQGQGMVQYCLWHV